MNDTEFASLTGERFAGPGRTVDHWENWLLTEHADEARMTMQVHDELILEVKESALEKIRKGLVKRMSAAAELDVPLLVEAGAGDNWDQAH